MPTCETCRFWDPDHEPDLATDFGVCTNPEAVNFYMGDMHKSDPDCGEHQPKDTLNADV